MTGGANDQAGWRSAALGRRKFLLMGTAGAATFMGSAALTSWAGSDPIPAARNAAPRGLTPAALGRPNVKTFALAATDGFVSMPQGAPAIDPYFPDRLTDLAEGVYTFGFRDVTDFAREQVAAQKGLTQISAPLIHCAVGEELWVTLTNLGLQTRPDLTDSHTMHWHGFRNAIPFYDGVPETSISVPIGRDFTYVFKPKDAGTYMYHCHFEDVEHVTMGMTGIVFVTPADAAPAGFRGLAYGSSDDPAKTAPTFVDSAYHREYAVILTEIDSRAHWNDAHIQTTDWTTFHPEFWLMNGRAYPDTLQPNGVRDTALGHLTNPGDSRLDHQPNSSMIVAAPGEKVLIRLVNLGFQNHTLVLPGIPMTVVGRDARYVTPAARRRATDIVQLGPGESRDVIITAPATPGDYPFYNRDLSRFTGAGGDQWVGGQRTVVAVRNGLAAQTEPNGWPAGWSYSPISW